MKKILLVLLVSILFISCAKKQEAKVEKDVKSEKEATLDPNVPGYTLDSSSVTLDWYINFNWFNFKFGQDYVSKEIVKKTGITINYIAPAGDPNAKLNTMIAGGELTDLITLDHSLSQVNDLIDGNLVYPLDELAKKYDPYFFKVAKKQALDWYRKNDGHIYGYPNESWTSDDYKKASLIDVGRMLVVRKDIYNALSFKDLKTPEGFLKTLHLAKEKYPKVNGKDLIPFGFQGLDKFGNDGVDQLLLDFLNVPMEKDSKIYDRLSDPEYKKWMKIFNQAYLEGLIPDDVFVDERSQIKEKLAQGRYFVGMYHVSDILRIQSALYSKDPNSIYISVDPPMNSKSETPKVAGPTIAGWVLNFISKKSKHPDRAIRLMSFLMSEEGQKLLSLGVKGKSWDYIDGKASFLPNVKELIQKDKNKFDKIYGAYNVQWATRDPAMQYTKWFSGYEGAEKEAYQWITPEKVINLSLYKEINPDANTKEAKYFNDLNLLKGEYQVKLIRAKEGEFDKVWDEWQQARIDAGLEAVLKTQTEKMLANKKKLGL